MKLGKSVQTRTSNVIITTQAVCNTVLNYAWYTLPRVQFHS